MLRLALTGVCLALLAALGACATEDIAADTGQGGRGTSASSNNDELHPSRNPTSGRTGPLPDGGASSCVESYAPAALAGREFAFDGVVIEVGPSVSDRGDEADLGLPGVTFEVREWFSGGRSDIIAVDMQPPTTGSEDPSDPGYAYGIGSRLLVSGEARWGGPSLEAPIAWGCGFSRYFDRQTARAWDTALQP